MRIAICVIALLLSACGEKLEPPPPAPATQTVHSAASAPAPAPMSSGSIAIRQVGGQGLVTVSAAADGPAEITVANGPTIRGAMRDSGKRKYSVGNADVSYEVKPGDDGFKLRTADGKLRWKVKIAPDKVKISDNEENQNPFELKTREGDRVKVVGPGERELGNVRGGEVENAAGRTLWRAEGGAKAAYGVLLLDGIPEPERYILLAELLARGR
jgi:hypothetical protein